MPLERREKPRHNPAHVHSSDKNGNLRRRLPAAIPAKFLSPVSTVTYGPQLNYFSQNLSAESTGFQPWEEQDSSMFTMVSSLQGRPPPRGRV